MTVKVEVLEFMWKHGSKFAQALADLYWYAPDPEYRVRIEKCFGDVFSSYERMMKEGIENDMEYEGTGGNIGGM